MKLRPLIFETIFKRTSSLSTAVNLPPFRAWRPTFASTIKGPLARYPVWLGVLDMKAYLNRLASNEATPGGGSAATLVGALGAALVAMVARITLGSNKHIAVHADAVMLVEVADSLRSQFVAARLDDEAAFSAVVQAQALPRAGDADKAARTARLQAALGAAAATPLRVAALATELLGACELAANLRNAHLISDIECAIAFGQATLDASAANVRINHRYMTDTALVSAQGQELNRLIAAASASRQRATAAIEPR